jgi:hypothetical protein
MKNFLQKAHLAVATVSSRYPESEMTAVITRSKLRHRAHPIGHQE